MINKDRYINIINELGVETQVIAVSKYQTIQDIKLVYDLGQRDFGENRVQDLLEKKDQLPKDIRWHLIGHLQSNKVKQILPFVHMIQSVDSQKLLELLQIECVKINCQMDILFQIHIAAEETKFGMNVSELIALIVLYHQSNYPNIRLRGLMGIATNTENQVQIEKEYARIEAMFKKIKVLLNQDYFNILSIGMSGDYRIAIKHGATMVRLGSILFGD